MMAFGIKQLMNIFIRISQPVLLLFVITTLFAQTSISELDQVYGNDPLLYNGKVYSYFPPPGTGGNQFLKGEDAVSGTAVIRGNTFENLMLKYDIFNQKLIMVYQNNVGGENQLVVSDAWLESFTLARANFQILAIDDTTSHIYQVLGNGHKKLLYDWHKRLYLSNRYGATNHIFTEPMRSMYLYNGEEKLKFTNNRSFVKLFGKTNQPVLRKFLRKNHIDVKKADDTAMVILLNYCNTLPE